MRQCVRCGDDTGSRRAKFCSDECRERDKGKHAECDRCGFRHSSVGRVGSVCAPCLLFDQIRIERKVLNDIVAWLRENDVCFYCGESATEQEHVVPQWTNLPTWVVPACGECNRFASGEVFGTVREKQSYIRDRRVRRYRKLLGMPEWTREEIAEMGPGLRSGIRAWASARQYVRSQIEWDPLLVEAVR